MSNKMWFVALASLAFLLAPCLQVVRAEDKPLRFIVGAAPGGTPDLAVRTVANGWSKYGGRHAIVENKPGAGTMLGAMALARAAPDGNTIGQLTIGNFAFLPYLMKDIQYDPFNDFEPIALTFFVPFVIVVNPSLPVKDVAELVAYLKANPDKVRFASPGVGTAAHLFSVLFQKTTGTRMTHVPYLSSAQYLTSLAENETQVMFATITDSIGHIQSGKLRVIAATAKERASSFPDLKTVAEQGYPDFDAIGWGGIVAPKGTPADVISNYSATIGKIVNEPEVKKRLADQGMDVKSSSPPEFAALITSEAKKWSTVIKDAGLAPK